MDAAQSALIEHLVSSVPHFNSRSTDARTMDFSWETVAEHFQYTFQCWMELPAPRTCIVRSHGVPLFVAVGDQILLYNDFSGATLWHGDWKVWLGIDKNSPDQFQFAYQLSGKVNTEKTGVEVDFEYFVDKFSLNRTVHNEGERQYLMTGYSDKGGKCEYWVDERPDEPSWRIKCHTPTDNGGEAIMELKQFNINQTIPPQVFIFPPFAKEGVQLPPAKTVGLDNMQEYMRDGMAQLLLAGGLHGDEKDRQQAESILGPIDWDNVENSHADTRRAVTRAVAKLLGETPLVENP